MNNKDLELNLFLTNTAVFPANRNRKKAKIFHIQDAEAKVKQLTQEIDMPSLPSSRPVSYSYLDYLRPKFEN